MNLGISKVIGKFSKDKSEFTFVAKNAPYLITSNIPTCNTTAKKTTPRCFFENNFLSALQALFFG